MNQICIRTLLTCWWLWQCGVGMLSAQKINDSFRYTIRRAAGPITVDGYMEEADWKAADVAGDFHMVLPMDTSAAQVRTEVRMTYDDTRIYLIAVCYHAVPGSYIVESLRRDFNFGRNDNFLLFMDPFDDQVNGFTFGANAAGAQWDGQMYDGGRVNLSWDNKWKSTVSNTEEAWIFECEIPFKTIRYKNITQWGINFSRLDLKANEKSAWAPVPRQFPTASLAYTGILVWDQPPPAPGPNISLIPYVAGRAVKDPGTDPADLSAQIGGDVKIAVTSSLNLDLTFNPDFSQVEVDRQVTNLSRFELFFPERRQFFLENSDLFDNFGTSQARPFFSRRIGLSRPIVAGARLSGKLDRNWRIGLMDMQTQGVDSTGVPSQNYAVIALQRRVFSRSSIQAIVVNRDAIPATGDPAKPAYPAFNRVAGIEYNLATANNIWTGKTYLHRSFSPNNPAAAWAHATVLSRNTRKLSLSWEHEYVGTGYNAETGFVPRKGFVRVAPTATIRFFPKKSGNLITHGPSAGSTVYMDPGFGRLEDETYVSWDFNFRNQARYSVWTAHNYLILQQPFDPSNAGGDTLARGSIHSWNAWGTELTSTPNKLFTWGGGTRYGGYFGGTRLNIRANLGYRFQPFVALSLDASYNNIQLPDPLKDAQLWLISPRLDFTLTNTLFFTGFLQYNNQLDNLNVNLRLQWRYRPASDLFIVYTDNYDPTDSGLLVKNRALVCKLTYWLNI